MAPDADIARVDLVKLDSALDKLAVMDPRLADVVQLRFFAGLSVEQVAEAMGSSSRTVKRDWSFAKAWLHRELGEE
jgi:RNA polymerase sigma factor (TIGR02999 family)